MTLDMHLQWFYSLIKLRPRTTHYHWPMLVPPQKLNGSHFVFRSLKNQILWKTVTRNHGIRTMHQRSGWLKKL